jgi:quinol monooxygenase YgiN
MPVNHVALFRWKPEVTPEQTEQVRAALVALTPLLDGCERYACGSDLHYMAGNHDFAVVAQFRDDAAYRAYANHPEHDRIKRDLIVPFLADRAAAQFAG